MGRRLDDFNRGEVEEEEARDWLRQSLEMLTGLAKIGLVHGDLNEFNIMVQDAPPAAPGHRRLVMIDFPQMVSVKHQNARDYFERDYKGIISFFGRVFLIDADVIIDFEQILVESGGDAMIDDLCKASGYKHVQVGEDEGENEFAAHEEDNESELESVIE